MDNLAANKSLNNYTLMNSYIHCLLFLFLLFSSCSEDDNTPIDPEYVESGFLLKGEIDENTEILFMSGTSAEKNTLYGIGVVHADGTPYAYGLFDDISLAKIKLQKGKKYTFRVMVVPNGKELCLDRYYGGYEGIFNRDVERMPGAGESCPLTNEFIYHKEVNFWCFDNPNCSFYYKIYAGYLPDYLAEKDNTLHMSMNRMFGTIRLISEDLKTGKLDFQFLSNVDKYDYKNLADILTPIFTPIFSLTPNNSNVAFEYSLRLWGDIDTWIPDDYSFTAKYTVRWIDEKENVTDLGIHSLKVQRNQETIVKLNLSDLLNK